MASRRSIQQALERIAKSWESCTRCGLHASATQVVTWRGNPEASVVAIGEAPGSDEDEQGIPFVGRSGRLLDQVLIDLDKDPEKDIFIVNTVGCHPPRNRNPSSWEMSQCRGRLVAILDVVQPKAVLIVGAVARNRYGNKHRNEDVILFQIIRPPSPDPRPMFPPILAFPAVATYHPAFILRGGGGYATEDDLLDDIEKVYELGGR